MTRLSVAALLLAMFSLPTSLAHAAESTTTPKMVTCKDGTKSEAGQGACSHHGGVKPTTANKPQTTGSKPATPAAASGSSAAHGSAGEQEPTGANDD